MSYFVDDFDTQDKRAALIWARDEFDSYDSWGWAMSWLFDLAGEIAQRGLDVPPELGYRPGAFGPDVSEDRAEGLSALDDSALIWAARVLNRFANLLRKAGRDY